MIGWLDFHGCGWFCPCNHQWKMFPGQTAAGDQRAQPGAAILSMTLSLVGSVTFCWCSCRWWWWWWRCCSVCWCDDTVDDSVFASFSWCFCIIYPQTEAGLHRLLCFRLCSGESSLQIRLYFHTADVWLNLSDEMLQSLSQVFTWSSLWCFWSNTSWVKWSFSVVLYCN